MPTKHRRIAVVEDPELAEALRLASSEFPGRSAASLLRELAIRGARSLDTDSDLNPKLQKILAMPDVRPAAGSSKEFLRELGAMEFPEGADPYRGTKSLEEEREERH